MTTYTTSLRLWQGTPGDPAIKNAWGTYLNTNDTLLDNAITGDNGYAGGSGGINIAGLTTYTLTVASGSVDQARQMLYPFVGALSGNCTVTLPSVVKIGWAFNATTGGKNVILTTGGGTTLTLLPSSGWTLFYCDGTNVTGPAITLGNLTTPGSLTVTGNATIGGSMTVGGYAVAKADGGTYAMSISGNAATSSSCTGNAATATSATSASSAGGLYGAPNISVGSLTTNGSITFNGGAAQFNYAANAAAFYGNQGLGGTGAYINGAGVSGAVAWGANASINCAAAAVASGFFATSDIRLPKLDINPIPPEVGLKYVLEGRPSTYFVNGNHAAGFVAQYEYGTSRELSVVGIKDDRPQFAESDGIAVAGVRLVKNYEHDIPYITAAIHALLKRIELLEAELKEKTL